MTAMARIRTNSKQTALLARLMRAEAEGEGEAGMIMVGNVGVNRVVANCLDFEDIRTLQEMVFQSPGGFEAVQKSYFYQKARDRDIRLARRVIQGERMDPASNALWFFRPEGPCPATWFNQTLSGQYKSHCFYIPDPQECPQVY
ncbi:cell wall hydrolase [Kroppenstedtia guangzhouensis]|uniref:Cell wall hydrolase n=2 Tax=Kroppenstedtia guangzhouensis TaxID=1274356 RepID=A0ABQ1H386_9BACL|nr:cell wall hydrolase [Kroppenstedtia guangzhouensis]